MLNFETLNTRFGYNRHTNTNSAGLGGFQWLPQRAIGRNRGSDCFYTGYDCWF